MDGKTFLRLCMNLPYYEGAVRKKLEILHEQDSGNSGRVYEDDSMPSEMSMSEALARSRGDHGAILNALNEDSIKAHAGPLFESVLV